MRNGKAGKGEAMNGTARKADLSLDPAEWSYGYWENLSAEEYARRQGVRPVADFEAWLGGWPKEEKEDAFEKALEKWRSESAVTR